MIILYLVLGVGVVIALMVITIKSIKNFLTIRTLYITAKINIYIPDFIDNMIKPKEFFLMENDGNNPCDPIDSLDYIDYIKNCEYFF